MAFSSLYIMDIVVTSIILGGGILIGTLLEYNRETTIIMSLVTSLQNVYIPFSTSYKVDYLGIKHQCGSCTQHIWKCYIACIIQCLHYAFVNTCILILIYIRAIQPISLVLTIWTLNMILSISIFVQQYIKFQIKMN